MEAASEGNNVGGAVQGGVGVVRVQPSCRQAGAGAGTGSGQGRRTGQGTEGGLVSSFEGGAGALRGPAAAVAGYTVGGAHLYLSVSLTFDLSILAGKLDACLIGLSARVCKEGAVRKAGLHQPLGQLDLQGRRRRRSGGGR